MIIASGTIISSLMSDRMTKKLGTGTVTVIGVFITAAALFGFSISDQFWMLCMFAIPYGLGAGAVDAALNNYVALHYASRHMNWLHCFWGVGATTGPYIMGFALTGGFGWNGGYRTIFIIQIILAAVLLFSLPLWKRQKTQFQGERGLAPVLKLSQIVRIKGVKYVLPAFFAYCAVEATAVLWASSYLVLGRGISPETAATYASLFFLGITGGRFLSGFVANKIGDQGMIKIGITVIFTGIAAVWLPVEADWVSLYGLVIIGLGCAPIYPSIIHSTPSNFGVENSQAIIGVQMASAYTGATFMPPLFGLIANHINVNLFPVFLLAFAVILAAMIRMLNRTVGV
jgi:fucose permease